MKRLYKLLIVLLFVVTVVGLTGCKKEETNTLIGKYVLIEMSQNDTKLNKETIENIGMIYTLQMREDNTFELNMGATGIITGTYDDSKMDYKDTDDEGHEFDANMTYKQENNKISLTRDNTIMVFEKE